MNTCTLSTNRSDNQGLAALYQENLTRIYQFIYVQVKNREVAEDLTSQVFLKAVRHLDQQHSPQSQRSWLLHVARTTIMDYWRGIKRAPGASLDVLLETGWEIPGKNAPLETSNDPALRVQSILQQLPARYGEVLIYRFLLGYTVRETSQIMGVSEGNVKVIQYRALNRAANLETALADKGRSHRGANLG